MGFLNKDVDTSNYFFSNKDLFLLFLPIVIEQFLEFVVGFADSLMVASLGEVAISGVSLVDFLMQFLIFGFSALATGGSVVAGQFLGDNNVESARNASDQLVWISTILAIILALIVFIGKSSIIGILFGQISHDVWVNTDIYLSIVLISVPFIALYNAGAAIYRTTGNAYLPMKVMLICDILNVIGNGFCIFYLGMGVEGVAIPTVLSRALAAFVMLYLVTYEGFLLHIKKTLKHKFDLGLLKKVLNVGIPYGVENGLFQLGRVLVLSIVSTFGTMAIAANSVAYSITIFTVLPGFAVNLGMTAVISRCVGANDYEQARYYGKKIVLIVYISQLIANIIIIAILPNLVQLYNLSNEAANMAILFTSSHALFAVFIWPIAFTLPGLFRGAGDAKFPMYVSIVVMFVCRVIFAYILAIPLKFGVFGTWLAMYIDWFIRSGFYIYRYFSNKWMNYRVINV